MFELYDKVIDWEYVRNKDIYEQINAEFIPYEENEQLQQITNALIQQTDADLQNITQSLGFYLDYGGGKPVLTPLAQVYQNYLDAACMDIVSGAFDYNSVLRRVVMRLTNSGLRRIEYASGWANRVDVAARRAVMTGITQLTGEISDMNAEKLGTEYFEIAWHAGARPSHAVWQGKVWSKEELVTVCGLGTVTGLEGANCYHERYPFVPGISERNWTDEWLEAKNREENTPKEFAGKQYTVYEAKQRQRRMETAMRAQRQKVQLLKSGGADPESDESLRERLLERQKTPPRAGTKEDYVAWAKEVPGVTRAWCYPMELGPGRVTVRFMTDGMTENGIPSSQMIETVEDHIEGQMPVTVILAVVAPQAKPLSMTLDILPDTEEARAKIKSAIEQVILNEAAPGGPVLLSSLSRAVGSVSEVSSFRIVTPTDDVTTTTGQILVPGEITYQ